MSLAQRFQVYRSVSMTMSSSIIGDDIGRRTSWMFMEVEESTYKTRDGGG